MQGLKLVFAFLGFWFLLWLFKLSFPYLAPFFLGIILAVILDTSLKFFEGTSLSRDFLLIIFTGLMFLVLPVLIVLLLVQLWQETALLTEIGTSFQPLGEFLKLQGIMEHLLTLKPQSILELVLVLKGLFKLIPEFFVTWLLANFSAYFFCKEKKNMGKWLRKNLRLSEHKLLFSAYHGTSYAMLNLVRIQFLIILLSGSISFLVFYLFNFPYATLLGILVGFFDLMPILGPGLVYLPLIIYQIVEGKFLIALGLAVIYLLLFLLRHLLETNLVRQSLGLHPLIVVMGLYVSLKFLGLLGFLVGPILLVLLQTIYLFYLENEI